VHPERPRPAPFVGPGRPRARAGRARRLATWLAGATAALLLAAPLAWIAWPRRATSTTGGEVQESILVLPFEVQSADSTLAWLREGSVNILAHDLATPGRLAVPEYERSRDLLHGAGLDTARVIPLGDALQLARRAGARAVVTGRVTTYPDSLTVAATAYDVATGQQLGETHRTAAAGSDPRPLLKALVPDILAATQRRPSGPPPPASAGADSGANPAARHPHS
jgi:TolB-like protein